jgi:Xaa-Pro aminopeptidase
VDKQNLVDAEEKRQRIIGYLDRTGCDALILGRQDNFSWYTGGGTNKVIITSELGCAALLFTREQVYLVAYSMDANRILDEEMPGFAVEPVIMKWHEGEIFDKAMSLQKGKRIVADVSISGAQNVCGDIYKLHFPLMPREIEKLKQLGTTTEQIIKKVALEIRPGMVDYEIEAMLLYEYGRINAIPEVILVGLDERIPSYRHCIPRGKKVKNMVLLHPALRKDGLHANVARTVCFEEMNPEISRRYDAAYEILAATVASCRRGAKFFDIHQGIKAGMAEKGFADEWEKHFVGGASGYMLVDSSVNADDTFEVSGRHAFDWFITITGAKVEELIVVDDEKTIVTSVGGEWPSKEYLVDGDIIVLPQIMLR